MTCIVALVHDKKVYIGTDSAVTSDDIVRITNDSKVFNKKNIVFGFAGSLRALQLLKYNMELPERDDSVSDLGYLSGNILNFIQATYDEWLSTKHDNGQSYFHGEMIILYNKKLYEADATYSLLPIVTNYTAIGSGAQYALGALRATEFQHVDMQPKERIELALSAAAEFSISVKAPFYITEYDV